jgi:hypothetical protein
VFVGKKSVVSMLEKLGFCDRARCASLDCGSSSVRHGACFGGDGVGGAAPRIVFAFMGG